ncbi:MAG: hypothetical protein N3F07_03385 [Candidatus Micrarchaeota archaeon]|nr:hypothetical protein [Candidatus Micrarchaeota archaeon]
MHMQIVFRKNMKDKVENQVLSNKLKHIEPLVDSISKAKGIDCLELTVRKSNRMKSASVLSKGRLLEIKVTSALVQKLNQDELAAVAVSEIESAKNKDRQFSAFRNIMVIANLGSGLIILERILSQASIQQIGASLVAFGLTGLFVCLGRSMDFERIFKADLHAAKVVGKQAIVSALRKMKTNLINFPANLQAGLLSLVSLSPTLDQRIRNLEKKDKSQPPAKSE